MASAVVVIGPCRKMTVFNVDPGIDSDTADTDTVNTVNEVGGKRMLSETDEDHDRGPVKKRRKQSKPVRIASSESLSDGESYADKMTPDKGPAGSKFGDLNPSLGPSTPDHIVGVANASNSMDVDYCTGIGNEINNKDSYVEICERDDSNDDSLLPINLSNVKCSTNHVSAGIIPSQSSGRINILEKAHRNDIVSSCQDTGLEATHFEKDATTPSPLACPTMKPVHSIHTPNGARHSGSPLRIFNPEAFCDLCNKEFCNKYFLKTHKANKHGIYSEHIGSNLIDALPSLSFINYFSSVNEVIPSNSQVSRSLLRKPNIPVPISQQNATFLQRTSSVANGNTRAFCNICQREFCNKYFVRRHKAKIHGIIDNSYPDTPPGEVQDNKSQSMVDYKPCSENHGKCEDSDVHSSQSELQISSAFSVVSMEDTERTDNIYYSENKIDHLNDDRQTSSLKQTGETDSNDYSGIGLARRNADSSPLQSMFVAPVHQADDMESSDKIRKIGITNSEAFCDICCKEYCNKYFLRTHKMKSHGIPMTDCDRKEDRFNAQENNVPLYNHTLPLNLIVGDQSMDKTETDNSEYQNGDVFCSVCGQKFKNTFQLKMHATYMHLHETYEKTSTQDDVDSKANETEMKIRRIFKFKLNNSVLDPCQNATNEEKSYISDLQNTNASVKCEICHKGFDPSLLEAHIENEHSNLLEELATIGEGNSDSQTSAFGSKLDCTSCQKPFINTNVLDRHITECHGAVNELHPNSINLRTIKETEDVMKNNQLQNLFSPTEIQPTPTSSFCEICKKELCNKYFMKTHMQRMHGISIDNGAHIGGVVCDICNKELCSKYFLRVHKQNSHGIVDEILGLDISKNQSPSTDPSLRPSEQNDLNNRYFSHFTEVCAICSRRFRSMKWLKAHLLNDHGEEGKDKWKEFQENYESRHPQEISKKFESVNSVQGNSNELDGYSQKFDSTSRLNGTEENNVKCSVFTTIFNGKNTNSKQYRCSYCPFSTSILAFLFVHERSHTGGSNLLLEQSKKFQCKLCSQTFESESSYEKHYFSHKTEANTSMNDIQSTYQNDKGNKVSVLPKKSYDDHTKEDGAQSNGTSPHAFNVSVKCVQRKELCSDENNPSAIIRKEQTKVFRELKQDTATDHGEAAVFRTYEGAYSDSPRKEYISDDQLRTTAEVDDEVHGALTQVKESLELIANKTDIPVSFSLPQSQKEVIMQPFVLEDSSEFVLPNVKLDSGKSFLSSIVFLPVKERLTNPVTVSFRLTPT